MINNEIAERESSLELLPPAQLPTHSARAMLAEHAQMMHDASQLAAAMVRTTMVPKRFFGRAGDATAAILYGAELGLNPIQSLQRVVAIHGMPSLEARTMVGLLKSRGYKVRTVEQSDRLVTVEGVAPDGETSSSTWTIERAHMAGYVPTPSSPDSKRRPDVESDWETITKTWDGKARVSVLGNMKYITDPQAMLKAKAQAEVCRELAPDVLMGISYTREDLESEPQDHFNSGRPTSAPAPAAPVTVDEIFADEVPIPKPDEPPAKTPAGDATPDAERAAPEDNPSPAEPETAAEPAAAAKPAVKAKTPKRPPAPAGEPEPKTRMRQALEKRLFALLGDAGISGDADRDGRLAVYRTILDRPEVASTNDLDDTAVSQVADQLYAWSQQNELDEKVAEVLFDAAREPESAAPAADPATEGNE